MAEKFDYDLVKILKYLKKFKDEKNKVVIKESRFETIKRKYEPYKQIYLLNNRSETFANWYYEKHLLGYTYGTQLKDIFVEKFPDLTSVRELSTKPLDSEVQLMANVIDTYSGVSKNKNKYIRFELSDETGLYKAMIVNNRRDTTKVEDFVEANEGMPEKGSILYVKGTKKEDIIFANVVRNQSCHVYTKLSQLKSIR